DKALANFDPEKITGDGNAFIGSSPSVNERHETIQGNNRVEILRRLYDEQPEKAAQYKQWLIDHAEEYGLDAAEIAKMKKPILVNELPVDDAKALELGQYRASDFESGGKELPRTSVVINRLGDKMQNVANIMLRQGTLPEDAKMSDLVSQNATKVLDYLVKEGVVSATEEQTLRKDSTAMRQWMGELLKTGLFEGDKETEAAFNQLPDNARRAVLATYLRDAKSGDAAKIKQNLQRSFEAYSRMMNNPAFVNAKNVEEARAAVSAEIEKGNNSLFGEEPVRELFSNFELELAVLYKGLKDQKTLTGLLNKYFDAVQGDKVSNRQLEIGEEPREAISKEEALKEVFGLHESKPAETQRQVDKAIKIVATEITKKTGIEVVTDEKEAEEVIRESEETDSNLKYHKETDEATLEELENGETVKVYRAMQVIDGKLYPPMAAAVNGKRVEANELGVWIRADENPDLAIPDIDPKTKEQKVDKKTGELKWKFKLDKGGKTATGKKASDIPAAYNPYWHTSRSPLNDQFKSAWIRPNIVVVECEVPVSELSSGYKAERAKDAVGEVDWKSGVVSGEVYKQTGRARKVILSRWCKPVRVLSDAEVAQRAKEFVGDAKVEIPENVLTPRQRIEFEKAGFKIGAPEKGVKKSDQILEALKRGLQIDNEIKEHRSRWAGGEVVGMKQLPDKLHTDPDMLWNEISQYHGDYITRKLEKVPEDGTVKFFSAHDGKWYFYSVDKNHTITLFDAVEASRENYELFKDKLKKYGFDGTTKAVRDGMQEAGYTGRTDGDKFESFIRPGIERSNGLGDGKAQGGRRADRRGMAGEDDGTQLEGNSEKQGEVKYFRTANGEVYGFTDGEKIYLDTRKMKPETPLHEYAHLWCDMLRKVNPKEWESVKKLFDEVDGLKDEVQKLYPELEGDALYEEMITTYSGREGTKKLEDVVRKLAAEEGKSVTESAKAKGFLEKVKEALTKYWKGVADVLGIHFTTAEEVADKVLADWAKGVDPRESEEGKGKSEESESKVEGNEPSEASLGLPKPLGEKGAAEPLDESASAPVGEEPLAILPKKEDNTLNPIVKAAENYKKDHPLTEEEIRNSDVDDIAKDMAVDYLNGEVTDDLHRAVYESIYEKVKDAKMKNTTKQADDKTEATEAPKVEASASPIEGMKNAAEKFAKEKEAATEAMGEENKPQQKADDAAVEASNKKVNDLWNDLLKAGREDLSASFIGLNARQLEVLPKLVSAMAENAYLRIKRGMHNLEDVVKEMRKEFAPAAKVFKKEDVDAIYEQMMNIRYRDGEQRMSLKEWADYYEKSSPKHKEELVGDSKTAEERKQAEKKFIDAVKLQLAFGRKIKSIIELRKIAERHGLKDIKDTDLQELAEVAIVMKARGIASSESTNDAVKFEHIKKLYENQPSLNQRDSERVMKQQYSTPAPYAFLADMYVKAGMEVKSALEPSAGNGMLTIGLPKDAVHVNDIDAQRLANLQRQGFKNITSQDGTQPFADKDVDVVVTNPPFGSATPKEYDGYKISSLEGQMAINALESMKDNGRAAIIIGGKTEYAKNGSLTPKDKALLGYLYSHYNVEDVINVDGSLYAKQGTTYPTRIILINGRRYDENAYPPVKDKARAEAVKSYDELYKRINDDILRSGRMDSPVGEGGEDANAKPNRPGVANTNEEGVRAGGSRESEQKPSVRTGGVHDKTAEPVSNNVLGTEGGTKPGENGGLPDGTTGANGAGADVTQSEGTGNNPNPEGRVLGSGGNGRPNTQSNADGATNTGSGGRPRGQLERVDRPVRGLSTEKVAYAPRSGNPFTLQSVMPADQQEPVKKNLEKLGDADQFLVEELGYNDKEDLYSHLAAEQVDSVALALQQAKKGNAFIIGDQTGIGKGRQAASFVRYAIKNSQIPIYFTKTPELLSDVYRDLVDVGSPELRPFILGDENRANVTDSEGSIVYKVPSKKEKQRVLDYIEEHGELPKEYDYILTTYSQVGNGVYEFDENGNRKERKLAKGKKFGAAAISGQARRDAIEKLMKNGYLILDESHTAGGDSGQGNYFQHIIQKAKNVTFFSATFAKRPDNMPIYALRTAMNQGGLKASDLIDAVKRGGATLQEIMSQALTQCGQMIRRERDMTGVTIDWKAIDDPEVVAEQREQYDSIIGLFNDIINFQRTYVSAYVDRRNEELAEVQSSMGIKRGTEALGIKNQPFASKAFNTVQQVLLSLKAKSAAERAIDYLKQGMKPVIALNNTNESQTGNLALGEEMDAPDLGTSLKKGLEGTLRYTSKNAKDESESGYINISDLGADAVEAYRALEEKIRKTSTGLSLSPIDVIKNELTKAGYKVGELTGRQTEFVYNENGTVTKVKRADTDKKKLAREFNDGQIDALILNKSAATGISLHASSKYADQRKRVMIVAQQQLDVNDEVQMRGRIDRTGQVARGAYEYVVSLIPAEQRLLMMFKAKLKSLDANTTSSQKSKFNEMEVADITNKYGDKVVKEYMAEHLDLYARMADPFGWEKAYGADLSTVDPQKLVASSDGMSSEAGGDASKLLGRMALLKVKEQEKMLQEIGDLYAAEIQRLNEMGENDLEITELPLKAKTINKGIWKEGSEPGGDNAFADNTYVEKVNMAVLKKPMKAEEVKKAQDGLTGNRSWDEYRKEKITAAKEYFDNKIAEATEKYEERAVKTATKAKEKYVKDAKKAQKDTGMSDEQIEKMAGYQYDSVYGDEKTKLDEVVKNLKSKYGVFERALETFNTDDAFVLPTDMNNPAELSGFGNSYGRLIDIKITDNFSPNASTVSFATLDGRRKITFPINGKVGIGSDKADVIGIIDRLTRQASAMGDKHLRVLSMDASNWDKLTSNESRKDGYIITGNLLQALIDTKEQGLGGQLVKYTTDTGEVKTGILMPEKFEPKGLANDKPINSVAEKFELPSNKGGITEITSSDGDVKIEQGFDYMKMARNYTIRVPKSNKKGGKYFLDKELLKMVDGGNFETRGNTLLAEVKADKLKDVLDRLSELGVKVREESEVHYRTEHGDASLGLSKPLEGRIAETVEKVSKQTGGKVKMVNSVEEIGNEQVRRDIENGKQVTGWYDEAIVQSYI
ncbi:strawberry notch C-terminal domain-containing protein, partial [Prevotella sp.]|uniref:strawberry notch C-terminal domain-containing protein n=1 Tax=Prevotella sp. TaxID=59823 RepID=UPI003077A499